MRVNWQKLATSNDPLPRAMRSLRRAVLGFSVPAPRIVARPILLCYVSLRGLWHFVLRVFVAEPLLKAYCSRYGRGIHTGISVHWITGHGRLIMGSRVTMDGKCSIAFTSRYDKNPTLEIGDDVYIGNNCTFTVARHIHIGSHSYLAGEVVIMESNGHPTDPAARMAGLPPSPEDVRPVEIGHSVWIGRGALIMPGVSIGDGSIVGAAAVVTKDVPAYTVAAGAPAKVVRVLDRPATEVARAA